MKEVQQLQQSAEQAVSQAKTTRELEQIEIRYLGRKGELTRLLDKIGTLPEGERKVFGEAINALKRAVEAAIAKRRDELRLVEFGKLGETEWVDVTQPGTEPPEGHLHLVTHAIREITHIFERIGFYRVRYPEVEWDWYAFELLNMPKDHPARDEWETFFISSSETMWPERRESELLHSRHREGGFSDVESRRSRDETGKPGVSPPWKPTEEKDLNVDRVASHPKYGKMVLTPHTSNGQVREMEKGKLPIRMVNISKCYRRQSDVSHVPMFHQFEGLLIDRDVSVTHLKGTIDYFVRSFFGPERRFRLRPFHFRFTEPSFEVDVSCGVCSGTGSISEAPSTKHQIPNKHQAPNSKSKTTPYTPYPTPSQKCRLCKSGWLELAGAGMVHPNVLRAGGIDPRKWSGFAFGFGVERSAMMKSGLELDDIRILYKNDLRFLRQF